MTAIILSAATLYYGMDVGTQFSAQMLDSAGKPRILSLILLGIAFCILPFIQHYQSRGNEEVGDFTGIFLLALCGGILMISYNNFIILFLGVEILSIAMYILAGSDRRKTRSNEAAIKYFIMGAFASALLLFGIGLYYASTLKLQVGSYPNSQGMLLDISILFILCGFLFKLALVPFHFWAPDVYEGTPTIFTAVMSTIVKIAGFAALYRFIALSGDSMPGWTVWFFGLVILASLLLGNILAAAQKNVKRLLAYSGIVQAAFILMGLVSLQAKTEYIFIFYLVAYSIASLVSFCVTHFVEQQAGSDHLDSFAGLYKSNPFLAIVMTVALLSLAGGPLTAGFLAKLFSLFQMARLDLVVLTVVGLVTAVISMYYYIKIINSMFSGSADQRWDISWTYKTVFLVLCIVTIVLGVYPQLLTGIL
ncbi:MAG TPA: NADH-quinone oxidoreductase subunit N [Saprospiraceae bacterium]|nr:NADH-quinone oxidoreductase subunit N [Saprospiraceae bacterium]